MNTKAQTFNTSDGDGRTFEAGEHWPVDWLGGGVLGNLSGPNSSISPTNFSDRSGRKQHYKTTVNLQSTENDDVNQTGQFYKISALAFIGH